MTSRKVTGDAGEEAAAGFLKARGYRIIERNFRCKYGEIDIIASEKGTLVFVEVKTRNGDAFGPASESVDSRKQRRMTLASSIYLDSIGAPDSDSRFDVVCVEIRDGRQEIELIRNAFEARE